jgi:hypothetical protein
MSKTNHRVNRDREQKLRESEAHRLRRNLKSQADHLVGMIHDLSEIDEMEELFDEYEEDRFVKIRRRTP